MPYMNGDSEQREPDERASLVDRAYYDTEESRPSSSSITSRLLGTIRWILRILNPVVSRRPWRLFEICDLHYMPPFLRRCCQSMLTAQWTHRLPIFQQKSPAELAASLIIRTLDEYEDLEDTKFSVIDFCSGGGGPIPVIEKLVNSQRTANNKKPIPFLLTDIQPHLDAWIDASARSTHLSFIPQPVDATDPPIAVISSTSPAAHNSTARFSSETRVLRLCCLAFHHFSDAMARKTLTSTLATADGFAIIELQDRRLFSLAMMLADFLLVFGVTLPWFWTDPLQMLFTYAVPVLPVVLAFDGFVSALRTRTFQEVMGLVDAGSDAEDAPNGIVSCGPEGERKYAERGDWVFEGDREMHTWPLGYMNYVVGRKVR